jgi:hypothetical protein
MLILMRPLPSDIAAFGDTAFYLRDDSSWHSREQSAGSAIIAGVPLEVTP